MNEAALWTWLKPRLPPGKYDRIESPISPGFPDLHYTITKHRRGVIELKATPQRSGYPFKRERQGLRPSQLIWWDNYLGFGGHGYIIAAIAQDVAVFKATPQLIHLFNDLSIDDLRETSTWWSSRRSIKKTDVFLFDVD